LRKRKTPLKITTPLLPEKPFVTSKNSNQKHIKTIIRFVLNSQAHRKIKKVIKQECCPLMDIDKADDQLTDLLLGPRLTQEHYSF
jgi:hypothetical protein